MRIEPDNAEDKGRDCSSLKAKIAELEHKLREENDKSDLGKIAAAHEIERYKLESWSLTADVSRLEEDCNVLQGRELRYQDRIEKLMEEIGRKETGFREKFVELKVANRDLHCAEQRAWCEVREWKQKFEELEEQASRAIEECVRENERKDRELAELKMENRRQKNEVDLWKTRCAYCKAEN